MNNYFQVWSRYTDYRLCETDAIPPPIVIHLLQLLRQAAPLLGGKISRMQNMGRLEQSLAVNLGMVMTKVQGKKVIPQMSQILETPLV